MIDTVRNAAENLFRRPEAEEGSDAAKLQDIRDRQVLRRREQKLSEKQDRIRKRAIPVQLA